MFPKKMFPAALLGGAAAVPLLLAAPPATGEEDPDDSAQVLPEISVTAATRTERLVENTPASTEVITGKNIRRSGATMLDEALQAESSLFTGADGNRFSIRGGGRADIIYMLDGRRVSGTSGRGFELNRIPVSHVERIEIVKGPGSVVYGSDAVAGVINVITRRPDAGFEGSVELQGGMPASADGGERINGSLFLGGGTRDTRFRLLADVLDREAYSEGAIADVRIAEQGEQVRPSESGALDDDHAIQDRYAFDEDRRESARVYNLRAGVSHWFTDDFNVELEAGLLREERERRFLHERPPVATGYTNNNGDPVRALQFPAQRSEDSERRDLAVAAEWFVTDTLELNYQAYESKFEMDRSNTFLEAADFGFDATGDSEFGPREVTFTDRVHDFAATWRPDARHTVLTGFEHKHQTYRDREPAHEPEDDQWVGGVFLQHEWAISERLDLVYGARHDETSTEVDNTSLQAGAVYRLAPEARLRVQYAEGFKLPELRSFHVDTLNPRGQRVLGAHVVDPAVGKTRHELDPETSRNAELGIAGDLRLSDTTTGHYDVGLFYTEFDDRIAQTRGDGDYRTFRNVSNARSRGVETRLGADFNSQVELRLGGTWMDAIDRESGETLTDTPELTMVASALWTPTEELRLQLRNRYVDEVRVAGDEWDRSFTLTSLNVEYAPAAWEDVTLRGGIDNLFDADNESSLAADPGRFLHAGLRYDF